MMDIFEQSGDRDLIQLCCWLVKRHLELGWDEKYGGIVLGLDIDGKQPAFSKNQDYKPLWVQIEALVATAYAYLHTGEDWCIDWHKIIQDYAYTHYPVPTGGVDTMVGQVW